MSEQSQRNRLRILAATLIVCALIVSATFFAEGTSERPAPIGLYPQPCGELGHALQADLLDSLGIGAYVLLAGWLVIAFTILRRHRRLTLLLRIAGWLILTGCASLGGDLAGSIGLATEGGSIGIAASSWLAESFQLAGSALILLAATLFGLTLAVDRTAVVLVKAIRFTGRAVVRFACTLYRFRPRLIRPTPAPQPVEDEPQAEPEAPETILISQTQKFFDENSPSPSRLSYELPSLKLLDEPAVVEIEDESRLRDVGSLLEKTFADFGLKVKVVGIHTGPVVTQYEIALETGLRVSRVTSLSDDLALNLKVQSVRIVAPLPGRNTVGIELPNERRAVVRLKELIAAASAKVTKSHLPLLLGKDSEGRPLVQDLADMPHLLIAGRTGTGKSVCLNSIILSLLLTRTPDECRLVMIDPKQVELAEYGKLPHLMHPVVTDNSKAEAILAWAVDKMEERYELMRRSRVRNIAGFNELGREEILKRVKPVDEHDRDMTPDRLPYIVIIVDEVGDLMMAMKKEVEGHIIRLAQKSRAAGIHLILTTQRPTVDVITGLIKSNLPARICFQVADRSNSRVVLDEVGAERLLGKGDMLFLQPNTSSIIRAQGSYASDQEILRIVSSLEVEDPQYDNELLHLENRESEALTETPGPGTPRKRDELYDQAVEIVIREGRGSVSLLQRALGIGYGRSARLIDFMAEDGIVGTYNGAQARDVLISQEQWNQSRAKQEPVSA